MGVISDVRFPINNVDENTQTAAEGSVPVVEKDPEAGLKLLRAIRKEDEYLPLIIESSESENREKAEAEGFHFVDKNSKKMSVDPSPPTRGTHGVLAISSSVIQKHVRR